MKKVASLIAVIVLLMSGVIYGLAGLTKVNPGETGIVVNVLGTDRGMEKETLNIGYRWVEPFAHDVIVYNTQEQQQSKLEGMSAGTADGQPIAVDLSLQTGLIADKVPYLHVRVGPDYYNKIIYPAMRDIIRNSTGAVGSDTIYTQKGRQAVQSDIEKQLADRFGEYGITFRANVRDIRFVNDDFVATLEEKAKAEQRIEIERRKASAAEQTAIAVANKADGDKQARIKAAEADREEKRLAGEGLELQKKAEANGILAVAKAEAEGIRLKQEAVAGPGGKIYASIVWAEQLGPNVKVLGYPLGAPGTNGLFNVDGVLGQALKIEGLQSTSK